MASLQVGGPQWVVEWMINPNQGRAPSISGYTVPPSFALA